MRSNIWIEIPLEEVDDDDLIRELENRSLSEDELIRLCKSTYGARGAKIELFLNVLDRFSIAELQEMFKDKDGLSVGDLTKQPKLFVE